MKLLIHPCLFSLCYLSLALFLICQPCNCEATVKLPPGKVIPAVIGFGDSIIDPGNNNHLKSVVKCNFSPYGQDFKDAFPTGRFGNGLIPTDLIGSIIIK